MKAHLLYPDHDFDLAADPLPNETELVADLELDHLFTAMAHGDRYVFDVARSVVLRSLDTPAAIVYRQAVLRDCLDHPDVARQLYMITSETLTRKKKFWLGGAHTRPEFVLRASVQVLQMLMEQLAKLRVVAEAQRQACNSHGLSALLAELVAELDDSYVSEVHSHLDQLRFRYGTRMSARLGNGNEGTEYLLHCTTRPTWKERLRLRHPALEVVIAERDEAGSQALGEIRDRGLWLVASALEQATQHIVDFVTALRVEAAFYVGCLNLADRLTAGNESFCMPEPQHGTGPTLVARGLYDPCLSLLSGRPVVGNDLDADGVSVIFITGANQGGKSTALRSIGIAQLMMQAGMFVSANAYRSDIRPSIFTHFKREEDSSMTSGKLDEELQRMSSVVHDIHSDSLLLCNESFASTNEREGSQIAAEIVTAMRDAGLKVVYVTHLFELADNFHNEGRTDTLFLRAPRADDRTRSFELIEGAPLSSSYGADIYDRVFGDAPLSEVD